MFTPESSNLIPDLLRPLSRSECLGLRRPLIQCLELPLHFLPFRFPDIESAAANEECFDRRFRPMLLPEQQDFCSSLCFVCDHTGISYGIVVELPEPSHLVSDSLDLHTPCSFKECRMYLGLCSFGLWENENTALVDRIFN